MALQGSLQPVSYWDLHGVARFVTGLSDAPVAIGTRASDSPGRRIHFRQVGPVDVARRTFSPIAPRGRRPVGAILRRPGACLPAGSSWAPDTFAGPDFPPIRAGAAN